MVRTLQYERKVTFLSYNIYNHNDLGRHSRSLIKDMPVAHTRYHAAVYNNIVLGACVILKLKF